MLVELDGSLLCSERFFFLKTQAIHTQQEKISRLYFSPYFRLFCTLNSHANSYNSTVTQCHVDGSQKSRATGDPMCLISLSLCLALFPYFLAKHLRNTLKISFILAIVMIQTDSLERTEQSVRIVRGVAE